MSTDLPDLQHANDIPDPAMNDAASRLEDTDVPDINAQSTAGASLPELDGEVPLHERRNNEDGALYKRSIYALPINVQMVIGTARPKIAELLQLTEGSVLRLDKTIEEPVDICVDNRVIARGELIETDASLGELGLRITEIVDIAEDMLL